MNKIRIAPSLMCADLLNLGADVAALERAGAGLLHIDVMDGRFAPNITLGGDIIRAVRRAAATPLDIHIMAYEPDALFDALDVRAGDTVSVHAEATAHLHRVLAELNKRGARAAAALNPATPLDAVEHVLDLVDMVLVMTVNPGFAGQALIPATVGKVRALRDMLNSKGYPDVRIEVDGNVSFANAAALRAAGADTFVGGTSSVYAKGADVEANIKRLKEMLEQCA